MRRRGKVDTNQTAIVDAFRQAGWAVQSLANVGAGCADLLVAHPALPIVRLIEVKASGGTLTPDQVRFHQQFPVTIVRSVDEALAVITGRDGDTFGG